MRALELPDSAVPLTIRCVTGDRIEITWRDGHKASFSTAYLRAHCPCALCRRQQHGSVQLPLVNEGGVVALAIRPVGRYGIGVLWADGHEESIYRYERLRQLCPCPTCSTSEEGIG